MLPHMQSWEGEHFPLRRCSPRPQPAQHPPGKSLFDSLHHARRISLLRFADQQVNVLRHDYVAYDDESVTLPDRLEHCKKQVTAAFAGQPELAMIAAASDEVQVFIAVVALESAGQTQNLTLRKKKSCDD